MEKLEKDKIEKIGWLMLVEKSMKKIWDNKKDDEFALKLIEIEGEE